MISTVLFDFHNTLATCDRWLHLEIRLLPGLALERLSEREVVPPVEVSDLERAEQLFRELRQGVRESGVELSAVEGTTQVLRRLGLDVAEIEVERVVAALEEECLPDVRLVPGADQAVVSLREAGYTLGVVSSAGYPPFVHMALEKLGLLQAFSVIVTSAGEGLYKSDPEIFRRALAFLGVTAQRTVHVGDHAIYDVGAAKRAGLATIWFTGEAERTAHLHSTSWEEFERVGRTADAVITGLGDLYAAVTALGRS
jgi:HAD superfamily hydrolase (TIGR01549 family)